MSVIDRDLTAPPSSPSDGDRYIVGSGATGNWAGWDLSVAFYIDGIWTRLPPRPGWRAWIEDERLLLVWDGAAWASIMPAALQNLLMLDIGTTADAANPFSAKLNSALWTARSTGEGGTGDLFYTMNKQGAARDLGFNPQQGYVSKALFGLFGSNNLRLAVSDDGSTFFDALIADHLTGIIEQPRLPRFKGYTNYDNYVATETWMKIAINMTEYNDQRVFNAASNRFVAPVAGTDPSRAFEPLLSDADKRLLASGRTSAENRKRLNDLAEKDRRRAADHARLSETFATLPAPFQNLFREVRNRYEELGQAFEDALVENIKDAMSISLLRRRHDPDSAGCVDAGPGRLHLPRQARI